jgi:hypothetical protein
LPDVESDRIQAEVNLPLSVEKDAAFGNGLHDNLGMRQGQHGRVAFLDPTAYGARRGR